MADISKVIDEIRVIFLSQGGEQYYGEPVSQFEHAAQSAILAEKSGFDEQVQIAAFLHDIGHLLPAASEEELMESYGRKDHEGVAADWLRDRGFSEKIAVLVENHVNAKRYLCYANPAYYNNLSEASRQTLIFQGGKMEQAEAEMFEKNPYFDIIIRMRRWDEAAKAEHQPLPDLDHFLKICENYLQQN
ncbi:phosphonate degradation HD-domain oxygenase [Emticicia sp. BO119]|uniref:phosphonate degradation HD-domain oxygenase n=1 Tax=Emticicia sp. BO119 TaxID=2757768 RepID=UPI0015F0EE22|nr:phosphonate degradation HD-domain oxygenase [Emticicia sp. BO119]MBA4852346.1 HD domain-containing protein [Emticicia sp. BO119]